MYAFLPPWLFFQNIWETNILPHGGKLNERNYELSLYWASKAIYFQIPPGYSNVSVFDIMVQKFSFINGYM